MLKYVQRAKIHFSPTRVGIKVPWLLASIDFFFVSTIGPCIAQYPQVSERCCSFSRRCETWVSSFSQLKCFYGINCFSILSRAWLLWPLCPLRIVSATLVLILCFDSRWVGSRFESANGWTTVNGGNHSKFGCSRGAGQARPHQKKTFTIIATSVRLSGPILNYMSYLGCYKPLTNWDAWSMSQSVCLAACLPVCLSGCLAVRPSVCLSVSLSLAVSLSLSVLLSGYPSVSPSIHLFLSVGASIPIYSSCPSACSYIHLFLSLSTCSYLCLPVYPRLFRRTPIYSCRLLSM